ncbi:MAG: hypothetical protein V1804_01530 [Patescibacteria group bacterium]
MKKEEKVYVISGIITYTEGKTKEKNISTTFGEKKDKKAKKAFEQFFKETSKEKHIGKMELTFSIGGVVLKKVIINNEKIKE